MGNSRIPMLKAEMFDFETDTLTRAEREDQRQLARKRQCFAEQFRSLQKQLDQALEVGPTWTDFRSSVSWIKRQLSQARKRVLRLETKSSLELLESANLSASIQAICNQVGSNLAAEIQYGWDNLLVLYRREPVVA